jgi:uncharacterized membrane protein YfcA
MLSGSIDPHYAIAGFLVGALVGVTGVGGGSLMTPILIVLFGVSPATAVGTDLLFAAATKTVGSLVHGFNRTIDWRVVRRLATGSIPMTAVALMVLSWFNMRTGGAHQMVTAVLSIALLLTAGALIARNKIFGIYSQRLANLNDRSIARLTIAMGAVLGILVTFSSVGAGAIGVTALVLLYPGVSTARIDGLCRFSHTSVAARGIAPWHFCWQLDISARSRHGATLCSGSRANRRGEQTCCRSFCPAESECCGGPYDTSFQTRMRSCWGGRARYGCNLETPKVLSIKAPAKLLTLAERVIE